jgi:hypothetical protein
MLTSLIIKGEGRWRCATCCEVVANKLVKVIMHLRTKHGSLADNDVDEGLKL